MRELSSTQTSSVALARRAGDAHLLARSLSRRSSFVLARPASAPIDLQCRRQSEEESYGHLVESSAGRSVRRCEPDSSTPPARRRNCATSESAGAEPSG